MFALDISRFFDERLIHRIELNRELFEQSDCFYSPRSTNASLDDIEEFTPVDPIKGGPGIGFFLLVKGVLDSLPAGLVVEKTDQCEAIENELFAHDAPLPDVLGGDPW